MPTYTFAADTVEDFVSWNSPAVWSGGVVPNSTDADVLIPTIIDLSSGDPYTYFITIDAGSSVAVHSLSATDNYLELDGTLTDSNDFALNQGSELDIAGSLSLGSLQNTGNDIQGSGQISSPGSIVNQGEIIGESLTLAFDAFQNAGTLIGDTLLTVKVSGAPGSFANLSDSILSGGTYGGNLDLDVGGSIVTDAAAIIAGGTIETFDPNAGMHVPLEATLKTIAAAGQLLVLNGDSYTNDNTLTIHGTIALDQTFLANGRTETFSAPGLLVAPDGELTADSGVVSGPIVNNGAISVTLGPLSDGSDLPASGHLVLDSPVTGEGSLTITAGTTAIGAFGPPISTIYISNSLELGAAVTENVSFGDNSGNLVLDDPQGFTGTIIPQTYIGTVAPPSGDDTVILQGISLASITGYSYSGDSAGGTLTLDQPSGDLNLQFAGDYVTSSFTLTAGTREFSTSPPSVLITETSVPCLAAGTRVTTAHGDVYVEDLIVGDMLATVSGETLPIVWIGKRKISCRQHPSPESVRPVRVARDAFAPNRPNRTLTLSPDHAVFVDDVLIPVRYLINDITITQAAVDEVTYYHVELPRHHVLLAEGLPVESYLDTGDRVDFGDAEGTVRLFPEFAMRPRNVSLVWDGHGFARLVVTGPELDAVRLQLERRALLLRRTVARRA